MEPVGGDAHCRNCGAPAPGVFCGYCGQETTVALPTFRAFMRDAAGRYVALDGRLWRTLYALLARPGFLTLEYFAGRRRRYIRPARLFLVLWLLLFAVIGVVSPPDGLTDEIVFVNSNDAAALAAARSRSGDAATVSIDGAANEQGDIPLLTTEEGDTLIGFDRDMNLTLRVGGADVALPPQLKRRYDNFKKLSREDKVEHIYAGVLRFGPYAMIALLPAFALLLKLAYLGRAGRYPGRPQRYAEHLVYAAHLHAFAALALLLFFWIPFAPLRLALALWVIWYAMLARQRVYRGRWWGGLLRAFFVGLGYLAMLVTAIAGLLGLAVMIR